MWTIGRFYTNDRDASLAYAGVGVYAPGAVCLDWSVRVMDTRSGNTPGMP